MSLIRGSDTAETDKPVVAVIKLTIDAIDAPEILAEGMDVLAAESRDLPGFLAAEILVSQDSKTIVILTEWSDHHTWSQSRYDARVGKMIELCYLKSTMLQFEIYARRARFSRTSIV